MFNLFSKSKSNWIHLDSQEIKRYQNLCERAADILKKFGKNVKPYSDLHFSRLTTHKNPKRVIENLEVWVLMLEEAADQNDSPINEKMLLWRMLQRLQLTPPSDLMDNITDDEIIEIYTSDNWQIYRSLGFFDYVIATVDEVATFVWNKDSFRETKISMEALRLIFLVKTGFLKNTFKIPSSLPKHKVTSLFSNIKQIIEVELRTASVLVGKDKSKNYLLTNKTRWISKTPLLPSMSK